MDSVSEKSIYRPFSILASVSLIYVQVSALDANVLVIVLRPDLRI